MKSRIHVNQHAIRANLKDGEYRPVITVKDYRNNRYGHEVIIHGPSRIVYPERPLACGARVWIETDSPVEVLVHEPD